MPSSKFSPIQIPIIITQLRSYPCVTALLELYLQSDCAIKVFQSLNAGIDSCSISLLDNYFRPAAYQVLLAYYLL